MKKVFSVALIVSLVTFAQHGIAQDDKSKRPSPPATATATLPSGAVITINYSQPSIKGRKLGTDVAPFGKVWRTGANEATTFETTKEVKVNGNVLPAGKYSMYTIPGENEWTVILNKIWNQWGTRYSDKEDVFRFTAKPAKGDFMEQMNIGINAEGIVSLKWANTMINFHVE